MNTQAIFLRRLRLAVKESTAEVIAVSYTHLDVYKRQTQQGNRDFEYVIKHVTKCYSHMCYTIGVKFWEKPPPESIDE